ncbi:MAG TPA: hypothetical protein VEC57_21025 [Candidatus Limnocylindrales bacterium]|nr:hypothetical protein [Candidatus Limnocylindrales bacterium]
MSEEQVEQIERKPAEEQPADFVRRWLMEWTLADSNEKTWREQAKHCYQIYEGGAPTKDGHARTDRSFNILWSNTETLLPAVYNSAPQPDVRRRFRDADPLGKAVSMVLERALSYAIDTEDFYDTLEDAVLDCIVTGRGVVRVKYEPKFAPIMDAAGEPMMLPSEEGQEPQAAEQKVSEKCVIEHVQWDRFRRGPGKRWRHVPWIGFEHDFNREQLVEMFGEELAAKVPLNYPEGMDKWKDEEKKAFGTAQVIEIWDKDTMQVIFISTGWKDGPLLVEQDPMEIDGFWPIPKPMLAIKNGRSIVPRPLYHMYEVKARELERISQRINAIVRVCKVRGVYDSTMSEVTKLLDEADNTDMIPVQNTAKYYRMGGLQKAIWMMPVGEIANVLAALYQAQNECKQTIYELTGISDVIRGATEASETATAQRLKAQFGGLRLKTLQREVKRFGRDVMRLIADVMCSKYDWQTFAEITGLQYPTAQEKQAAQMQLQQAQRTPPQVDPMTGQAMPPPPPDPAMLKAAESPSWEEISEVMKSDRQRCYKVDIETDSTIAETLEMDMAGMQEALTAIMTFISGAMPGLQSGMISIDLIKSVALSIARRARMGSAVEDAIEQIQQPAPPQPDPAMVQAADEAKAGREESGKAVGEVKAMIEKMMQAVQQPKRIRAQANQMGEIDGELVDA